MDEWPGLDIVIENIATGLLEIETARRGDRESIWPLVAELTGITPSTWEAMLALRTHAHYLPSGRALLVYLFEDAYELVFGETVYRLDHAHWHERPLLERAGLSIVGEIRRAVAQRMRQQVEIARGRRSSPLGDRPQAVVRSSTWLDVMTLVANEIERRAEQPLAAALELRRATAHGERVH